MLKNEDEDELKTFIINCGQKRLDLFYKFNGKTVHCKGNFYITKFIVYAVDNCRYKKYNEGKLKIAGDLNGFEINEFVGYIGVSPEFIRIHCNNYEYTFHDMCEELQDAGKLRFTMVAEDKRSGPNLIKFGEIDGMKVNHNYMQDALYSGHEQGQFFKQIMKLFEELKVINDAKKLLQNHQEMNLVYEIDSKGLISSHISTILIIVCLGLTYITFLR